MNAPLFLIRHTTVAMERGICYGQLDVGLAESFTVEALAISQKIKNLAFATTYCSPLQRCTLLAQALKLQPKFDSRLMEMNFGQWEGKAWDAIYASEHGKRWFNDYWTTPCPGGESFQQLMKRVESFLQEFGPDSSPPPQKPLCIVTHAGIIRAMLIHFCQLEPASAFDITVPYGQIISINQGHFTLL